MNIYASTDGRNVTVNGKPLELRLNVVNHSPDGFNIGYLGSGPAQFACAVMCEEFGEDLDNHPIHYQLLKEGLIAKIQQNNFEFTSEDVQKVIKTYQESA